MKLKGLEAVAVGIAALDGKPRVGREDNALRSSV